MIMTSGYVMLMMIVQVIMTHSRILGSCSTNAEIRTGKVNSPEITAKTVKPPIRLVTGKNPSRNRKVDAKMLDKPMPTKATPIHKAVTLCVANSNNVMLPVIAMPVRARESSCSCAMA